MGPPRVVGVVQRAQNTEMQPNVVPCCEPPRRQHCHFFCPRNKQLDEEELPSVDIVRKTRSLFEARNPVVMRPWTDSGSVSSGVSSAGDFSSPVYNKCDSSSDWDEEDEESDLEWEPPSSPPRFVPATVMDRIRARGTSITYFGGRVLARSMRPTSPTRTVLTEIQRSPEYQAWIDPASGLPRTDFAKIRSKRTAGGRCRLVKSNSVDSRLEIMATQQATVPAKSAEQEPDTSQNVENTTENEREESERSWYWPGKTSVLFDFRKPRNTMNEEEEVSVLSQQLRPRRYMTLSGVVASAHARLCATSTTTL